MITKLRALWKQAFDESDVFLDAFFSTAYDEEHSACVIWKDQPVAALYWLDCSCRGKKIAYMYAVATEEAYRGKGLCRDLMDSTHKHLAQQGYAGAILVPGSESLFRFYEKLGYQTCSYIREVTCPAGTAVQLTPISRAEYAARRLDFLPEGGVVQDGTTLELLGSYATFYAGEGFIAAASIKGEKAQVHELLGNAVPSAVVAALGAKSGTVRMMGKDRPFAMYYPLTDALPPAYLGIALD